MGPTQPPTPPPTLPPTPPPTPPPTVPRPTAAPAPSGPVDPFNCAVDPENTWKADKRDWCCRVHHRGCPQPIAPPMPLPMPVPMPVLPQPARPADPYNCADGFSNWQAGWSVGKKEWYCRVHGKGCPNSGGGCAPIGTTSPPYDCNAGFANWQQGWSLAKKIVVLHKCGQGMPYSSGRVCLSGLTSTSDRGAVQTLAHVCHLPVSDAVATRHNKQLVFFSTGGLRSSERTTPFLCAGV